MTNRQRIVCALLARLPRRAVAGLRFDEAELPGGRVRITALWSAPPSRIGSMTVFGRESGTGATRKQAEEALLARVYAMPLAREAS